MDKRSKILLWSNYFDLHYNAYRNVSQSVSVVAPGAFQISPGKIILDGVQLFSIHHHVGATHSGHQNTLVGKDFGIYYRNPTALEHF